MWVCNHRTSCWVVKGVRKEKGRWTDHHWLSQMISLLKEMWQIRFGRGTDRKSPNLFGILIISVIHIMCTAIMSVALQIEDFSKRGVPWLLKLTRPNLHFISL